jgi:hypothetical protein
LLHTVIILIIKTNVKGLLSNGVTRTRADELPRSDEGLRKSFLNTNALSNYGMSFKRAYVNKHHVSATTIVKSPLTLCRSTFFSNSDFLSLLLSSSSPPPFLLLLHPEPSSCSATDTCKPLSTVPFLPPSFSLPSLLVLAQHLFVSGFTLFLLPPWTPLLRRPQSLAAAAASPPALRDTMRNN